MSQTIYEPTVQLFLRAGVKNGKPAILLSKWITDPEAIEQLVRIANSNQNLNAILNISDKIKFYGSLAETGIIKYDLETGNYYFNFGEN